MSDIADRVKKIVVEHLGVEEEKVVELIDRAADACESWWNDGNEPTMNRFNS